MIDLIGKRFGRLVVIGKESNDKWQHSRWLCVCDCSMKKIINMSNLKQGRTNSCGCLRLESVWNQTDMDFLIANYFELGASKCAMSLNRPVRGVYVKASRLKLRHKYRTAAPREREKIDDTHCLVVCKKHGKCKHRINSKTNKISCLKCHRECDIKRSKEPDRILALRKASRKSKKKYGATILGRYANSLRNAMHRYRHGMRGCFSLLPYSPRELCDYLEQIRDKQEDKCPICTIPYEESGFHVDHIIPLRNAKNKEELLQRFVLANLSLLCPSCNIGKGSKNV